MQQLRAADYPGLAGAAQAFLAAYPALPAPQHAALAVATPVAGDRIALTNSAWAFSQAALCQALQLTTLCVVNDFEALALALPGLAPSQLHQEPGATSLSAAPTHGTRAVIGPGTGLGVAGLVHTGAGGWQALPGEGGHATLAPADDFESALLAVLRHQFEHVSAERLLSGPGLRALHQAVAQVNGTREPALTAEQISAQAIAGESAVCVQTVDVFCALLGGFAGNVALTLGARGGVYIGGGIVPRWGDLFFKSRFRERFEAKGRFRAYLQAIPTALITDTQAALGGAAAALAQQLAAASARTAAGAPPQAGLDAAG